MATATMAHLFVRYIADWQNDERQTIELHEYLVERDLIGEGDGQINFLSWWECIPKDRSALSISNYAVMDFGDGSIAIRRNHEYAAARWQVAA